LWMKRSIAVIHSDPIILVLGKGLPQSLHDLIGTPLVRCVFRPQHRPFHVGSEMFLMRNHHVDSPLPVVMTIHIHVLAARLSLCELTHLSQTCTVHHSEQASRDGDHKA